MKEPLQEHMNETLMKAAFIEQSRKVLCNEFRFIKQPGLLKVGLEMEASLCTDLKDQVPEETRNQIVSCHTDFADMELGASQIEWRTDPVILNEQSGVNMLFHQALARDRAIHDSAEQMGAHVIRMGANPFIPLSEIVRTDKNKYQRVPDFHNMHRSRNDTFIGKKHNIDVGDAAVVALLNSLQCNLEAADFEDAVDLTNRSLMISPFIEAISGNARILSGVDTGLADLRMIAWETSHDTRTREERMQGKSLRVGLPMTYFSDLSDYFERISNHPFILDDVNHALQIGIGLFWQDTRIKVIGDSLVVEFRPVSIQPTVEEDIAVMLFYLGRLQWSKTHHETMKPLDEVREERALAMRDGIKPFQSMLGKELEKAYEGLCESRVDAQSIQTMFCILQSRVENGQTPSDVWGIIQK